MKLRQFLSVIHGIPRNHSVEFRADGKQVSLLSPNVVTCWCEVAPTSDTEKALQIAQEKARIIADALTTLAR